MSPKLICCVDVVYDCWIVGLNNIDLDLFDVTTLNACLGWYSYSGLEVSDKLSLSVLMVLMM